MKFGSNIVVPENELEMYQVFDHWYPDRFPAYEEIVNGHGGQIARWILSTPDYTMRDAVATAHLLYGRYTWYRAGKPTYEMRPLIFQALRDTQVPEDFLTDEIKTPFEGMMINLPPGAFLEVDGLEAKTVYVTNVPEESCIRIVTHSPVQQATQHARIPIIPGKSIEQAIEVVQAASQFRMEDRLLVESNPKELAAYYQGSPSFCFTINLILYLACPDVDILQDKSTIHELHTKLQGLKKGHKRDALEEKLAEAKKTSRVYIIGAAYKEPTTGEDKEEGGKKWTLQKRIRVPGFWRWQPYGPKHSLRRRQFIPPHWRGPTFAEQVERNFVVSDRNQMQKELHEAFRDDPGRATSTSGALSTVGSLVSFSSPRPAGAAGQGDGESGREVPQ